MKEVYIFAYGSLLNKASLHQTLSCEKEFIPAKIKGFLRVFNVENKLRFDENLQQYTTALNLDKSEFPPDEVNGVLIKCSLDEVEELGCREKDYELIQIEAYTQDNSCKKAFTYRVVHFDAKDYLEGSPLQQEYLTICLTGAKELGAEFYEEFLSTTYIGKKTLKELNF